MIVGLWESCLYVLELMGKDMLTVNENVVGNNTIDQLENQNNFNCTKKSK